MTQSTSQEIQLAFNPSLPVPQPGTQLLAPMPDPTPLRKIHGLLRGRYALAIVLALIGAVAGLVAGILVPKPAWYSDGMIQINPIIPTPDAAERVMPLAQQYVNTVIARLHSERVIKDAMTKPELRAKRVFAGSDAIAEFSRNLVVRQNPPGSQLIQITYTDNHQDAKEVVQPAVWAIIAAYKNIYGDADDNNVEKKLTVFRQRKNSCQAIIEGKNRLIADLGKEFGDDLETVIKERQRSLVTFEHQKKMDEQMLTNVEADLAKAGNDKAGEQYTAEDIGRVDGRMQQMISLRNAKEMEIEQLLQSLGVNNQQVKNAKLQLAQRNKEIDKYVDDFRKRYVIRARLDGQGSMVISRDMSELREQVKREREFYKKEQEDIDAATKRNNQILQLKRDIEEQRAEMARIDTSMNALQFQKELAGTMLVLSDGDTPQTAQDRRPVFAALGFLGGGALPIALLVLAGLLNPRYRFSDETGDEMSGLTLLGILPDLPDRLSDPEQASIAAHCVHQIRTMLQINGGPDERRVFAVTSAAPGDGKTSLTLALGLSYAACGTRTLLIDCDLVGAGLSARMNISAPDGVLEAIANRSLLDYVRTTDIADVAVLPVGAAQTLHASTLSPAALRRLIDEAKKHFDTILIDTGPILGSIEASLVCAAADAVVLTVARGQQRPLVEKAVGHLNSIGAHLAGVVFNRAQASDFDRSISGASMRSQAAGHGHNAPEAHGARFGPVARAVHSSFKAGNAQ